MLTAVLPEGVEDPGDPVLRGLTERQQIQEQQLEKQRHALAEMREQLTGVMEELRHLRGQAQVQLPKAPEGKIQIIEPWCRDESPRSLVDAEGDVVSTVATYSFDESMWDAVILLFLKDITWAEKFVLVLGLLLNLGLQVVLLVVVALDMLDNPFDDNTVKGMMKWRVDSGHSDANFDSVRGQSLATRLCAQTLWSYEQDKYKEMYDYLYKPVPGFALSMLAIILWVLTSMVEYRQVTEQVLALVTLPRSTGSEVEVSDDEIRIVAIRKGHRILALFLVTLPRFAVLASLCVVGCEYLARTVSLSDIVLNAVALAFILDVDELLFQVLLPQRLRDILQRVQPLPCGTTKGLPNKSVFGFVLKDIVRYTITLTILAIAILSSLVPFHNNVNGAAAALCSGLHDFTYTGGSVTDTTVVLMNTSVWTEVCDDTKLDAYMRSAYGVGYNASTNTGKKRRTTQVDWDTRKLEAVYSYALKGCDGNKILNPDRICVTIPNSLNEQLPQSARPGQTTDPPSCPRFTASLGAAACDTVTAPTSCQWDWLAQVCEEDTGPPGSIHGYACGTDLSDSCGVWEHTFGLEHPTKNCMAAEVCPADDTSCISIIGQMLFGLGNASAFVQNQTLTEDAVKASLVARANVRSQDVYLQFPNFNESSSMAARFLVTRLPDTTKPASVLSAQASLATLINTAIYQGLGTNSTVSSVDFASTHVGSSTELLSQWQESLSDEVADVVLP